LSLNPQFPVEEAVKLRVHKEPRAELIKKSKVTRAFIL
jgi:hypothetical protein